MLVDASEMGQKQKRIWLWKSLRHGTMNHNGSMEHDGLPHGICLSVCFQLLASSVRLPTE